jgi:hypothetical protein
MHVHLFHWFAVFVKIVGGFHKSAIIVVGVMVLFTLISIYVFYRVFEHDLFDNTED